MTYRFILNVPENLHESAKAAVSMAPDARILIERRPNRTYSDNPRSEIGVSAYNLDIIDTLYEWLDDLDNPEGIYLDAYKGGRVSLLESEPKALRRLIQGNQYWLEYTMPNVHHLDSTMMGSGADMAEVSFSSRPTSSAGAEGEITLDAINSVAVRVRNPQQAEAFYRDFFGMQVLSRSHEVNGRSVMLPADYSWDEKHQTGVEPSMIRLANGPVSLDVINVGAAAVLLESRVAYISVNVALETLNALRGRALFNNLTVQEDSASTFRFVDPFGVNWQLIPA